MSVATSASVFMVSESICLATVTKEGTERMISSSNPGDTVVRGQRAAAGVVGTGAGAGAAVGGEPETVRRQVSIICIIGLMFCLQRLTQQFDANILSSI